MSETTPTRRLLVKGAAWSVPVVAMSSPAAFAAASCSVYLGFECTSPKNQINVVTFTVQVIGTAPIQLTFTLASTGTDDSISVANGAGVYNPNTGKILLSPTYPTAPAPLVTVTRDAKNCGGSREFTLSLDSGAACAAAPVSVLIDGCSCPA